MDVQVRLRELRVDLAQKCREKVEADLAAFDLLSIADPERQLRIRRELRRAARRFRYADEYPDLALRPLMGHVVWLALVAGVVVFFARLSGPISHSAANLLWFAVSATTAGFIPKLLLVAPAIRRRGPSVAALASYLMLPAAMLYGTGLAIRAGQLPGNGVEWAVISGIDTIWLAWLACGCVSVVAGLLQVERIARCCWPYDGLVLGVLHVASEIARDPSAWRSERTVRRWCNRLEDISVAVETVFALRQRTPWRDRPLRRDFGGEALRVAEVFRAHKRLLLTAFSSADVQQVVESLTCAVEALLAGDRQALLENAPEQAPLRTHLRRLWARLAPGAALIAAGILLPMFMPLPGTSGTHLQQILITLGIVQAVAPSAAERVGNLLEKALSSK
ncbi:hypothetical protein QMK19_35225 [Streptomyces sp. H10-C2]|uniref:hypothetical protein n=1 Tax=unclassified Streptomyces TaxID=2593676 RepID=UPI0024BAC954|nr:MULTISPECIES: hypothetical protein [unclassified Streptomyces]MDJ0345887.1 hypothetical protein [Streptomyces sp. PH10-H1]MDJ0374736.1 hypothetical protein [Streptomyces sp. H10-C2]